MKHISFVALCTVVALGITDSAASPVSYLNASGIAANNIMVMQHSVMLNAFKNFDGSMAYIIDTPKTSDNTNIQPSKEYGTMLFYGEYGDDGTIFLNNRGRNGGDSTGTESLWLDWQHSHGYARFDGFNSVDSHADMISFGVSGDPEQSNTKYSRFGGFGGVAFARENAHSTKLSESGEYVGLYFAHHNHNFVFQAAANMGALFVDAESSYGTHEFTNLWMGAAMNASYNLFLDDASVLQPSVYIGYTWIHTNGYEPQPNVSTDNFNMMEISPAFSAISHITDGWYASMSARYVFNLIHDGNTYDNHVKLPELDLGDYCEYGISVEKAFDRLNLAMSINRRDGGRTGWIGGLRLRYVF